MESPALRRLIEMALEEDIGPGDITTAPLVDPHRKGTGRIVAKEPLRVAGLFVAKQVFSVLDADATVFLPIQEGDSVQAGSEVFRIEGNLRALLAGERTALNFLQRLSGIATAVAGYVEAVQGTNAKIVDTRKTTPGWRTLEKYAVRMGGASNHRMGLYDGILIKDNHIKVCGGVREAVGRVLKGVSHLHKIEVEAADLDQVKEALEAGAHAILLDNMDIDQIRKAVEWIGGRAVVEVSGGVQKQDLPLLARCGVDLISIGALTHSARAVDLSMDIEPVGEP